MEPDVLVDQPPPTEPEQLQEDVISEVVAPSPPTPEEPLIPNESPSTEEADKSRDSPQQNLAPEMQDDKDENLTSSPFEEEDQKEIELSLIHI